MGFPQAAIQDFFEGKNIQYFTASHQSQWSRFVFFFCSVSFYLVQFFYIEFFNIFRSPVIRKGQEEGENSVPEEGQCGKKEIEQLEIFPKFKDRLRVSRKITQENVGSFMV